MSFSYCCQGRGWPWLPSSISLFPLCSLSTVSNTFYLLFLLFAFLFPSFQILLTQSCYRNLCLPLLLFPSTFSASFTFSILSISLTRLNLQFNNFFLKFPSLQRPASVRPHASVILSLLSDDFCYQVVFANMHVLL